jgi:hemoglobin/transferrin/lactoferrin receptor protein
MTKLLWVFALIVTLSSSSWSATITGSVRNIKDGSPVPAATITVKGSNVKYVADSDGNFSLDGVEKAVLVTVTHVGYIMREDISLSAGGDNVIELLPGYSVLNSMVITANRYEKEAYKVTQPITVAGAEEIAAKGHTIVSDIIRTFPGIDMNDAGPFRTRPVIRGLFGTRVLVLVDGERLNDQRDIVDFAGVSMSLVDPNEIERVEVVNGPSSVLYGSDAMAGVINIITKPNMFRDQLTSFARYSTRYSTADQQSSNRIDVGLRGKRLSGSIGLQYREANQDFTPPDGWNNKDEYFVYRPGFYDSLNADQGTSFDRDKLANSRVRVNNYDARLAYKLATNHRLDFDFGAFRAADIGFAGVPNDSTPFLFFWPRHDRDNVSLTYTGSALTDKLASITGKIYYEKISKDFFTNFYDGIVIFAGPPPNPPTITPQTSLSTTEVEKFGLNFQELYQLSRQATLTFGFDAWREQIDGQVVSISRLEGFGPFPFNDTTTSSSVPKNNWHALGVYASGEVDLEPVLLTGGLRFDNFWINTKETPGYVDDSDEPLPTDDQTYNSLNGSFGAVYPIGRGVNLVGNVGTAYRVPNVVERFFFGSASGRETRPNIDITP